MTYLRDNYLSTEIFNTFIRMKYGILVVIIFMIFFIISINVEVIFRIPLQSRIRNKGHLEKCTRVTQQPLHCRTYNGIT